MEFEELMNQLGVQHTTSGSHSTSGWIQIDCPFCHNGQGKSHLGYNVRFGYANCWKCGKHSLTQIIQQISRKNWAECKQIASSVNKHETFLESENKTPGKLTIPKGVEAMTSAHKTYLKKRGFSPKKIARTWGVQGLGIDAITRYSWRLFIPIYHKGQMVSWTTRTIDDAASMKYLSASSEEESISHKNVLYGSDFCRHTIIVVEGPTDAWNIGPGAAATLGTSYRQEQLAHIAEFPSRVICFDSSGSAQQRARKLAEDLSVFAGTTHNVILDAEDPGSATKKEIHRLRNAFL